EAMERCCGQQELLQEMTDGFSKDVEKVLRDLDSAVARGDAAGLAAPAHRLKSTVLYLGARPLLAAILRIEQIGHSGDLRGSAEAFGELQRQVERLKPELCTHHESQTTADAQTSPCRRSSK